MTDSSHANAVFFDGNEWITPSQPLLRGTKRQTLLEQGVIREGEITLSNLSRFRSLAFINAMLDIGDIPLVPIVRIRLPAGTK